MEQSILNSTKKVLGIDPTLTVFDQDVLTFINSAFSTLTQLGLGPAVGFWIEDDQPVWDDYGVPDPWLGMVKSYVFLRSRFMFDPPGPAYLTTAMSEQIREHEWRLNVFREYQDHPLDPEEEALREAALQRDRTLRLMEGGGTYVY